ncbi:hypothetical protein [Polluticoccus soli]|uniref:hypothetical protein n=1 Tax=Polluticoccus soli TaxID=3034150 RepID=UPI0023E15DCA|nr:hypothetical protein [Flavipsychrobacter sp. JY13-12]
MKRAHLALGLLFLSTAAFAQSKRIYTDEGFDTKKVEKLYSAESPGKQFCARMAALYKVSDSGHITQNDYNRFLMDFDNMVKNMAAGNVTIPAKLVSMSNILNEINDVAYNIDGHRDAIYHLAAPIYKSVTENWGDEVINTAIATSYFNLREYVVSMANDTKLTKALAVIDRNPVGFGEHAPSCDYAVSINPTTSKDKIDIYFSNVGLFYKATKKYPADGLLAGPIIGWEGYKDESESIMNILKTYSDMNNNTAYHIQPEENKTGKSAVIKHPLNSDSKWFVWVFRNNKLYYSYMAEPCGDRARCRVN